MEYKTLIDLAIKHNLLHKLKDTINITQKDILFEGIFHGKIEIIIDLIESSDNKEKFANDVIAKMLYSNIRHKNELKIIKTINDMYHLDFKPEALHISKWFERVNNDWQKPNYSLLEYLNKLTDEKYNNSLYTLFLAKKSRNKKLITYAINKTKNKEYSNTTTVESVLTYDQHIDDDLNYLIFNNFKKNINLNEYIKKLRTYKKFDLLEKIVSENIKDIKVDNSFFVENYIINSQIKNPNYYKLLKENNIINKENIESILFSLSDTKDTENILLFIKELAVDKNEKYIRHLFDYIYPFNDLDVYKKIEDFHDGSYDNLLHIYARTYLKNKKSKIFEYVIKNEKKENLERLFEENQHPDKERNAEFEKMLFNEILKPGKDVKKMKI